MTENDRLIYGGAISRMTTALERESVREGGRKHSRGIEKCGGNGQKEGMQRERGMTELNRQRVERGD